MTCAALYLIIVTEPAMIKQQQCNLDQPCSDPHLNKIAKAIDDWSGISSFLGLSAADKKEIQESNPHSVLAQKVQMMRRWKEKNGAKATYKHLCQIFSEDCERADLVDIVKQLVATASSSYNDDQVSAVTYHTLSALVYCVVKQTAHTCTKIIHVAWYTDLLLGNYVVVKEFASYSILSLDALLACAIVIFRSTLKSVL